MGLQERVQQNPVCVHGKRSSQKFSVHRVTALKTMNGTVIAINPARGAFVVQVDGGGYSAWFNLSTLDLLVMDRVRGDLYSMGQEELLHLGHGEPFSAKGESGDSSLVVCRRLIA